MIGSIESTASLLFLQHPFVTQPLSRTLAIELLDKASNPDHSTHSDAEEDDIDPEVIPYICLFLYLLTSGKPCWGFKLKH